jgi:uncharacterized protein DUF4180
MTIETHHTGDTKTAEVISEGILIHNPDDGLQLMGDLYYQGFDKIILHEKNLSPDFFDLKTGIAGEILQKFSNYRVPVVIVGDFSKYGGKSIKDFIFESNNGRQVNFLPDINTAIEKLSE